MLQQSCLHVPEVLVPVSLRPSPCVLTVGTPGVSITHGFVLLQLCLQFELR